MLNLRIVPIGVSPKRGADNLTQTLQHLWPVEEATQFEALLKAVDDAEREVARTQ